MAKEVTVTDEAYDALMRVKRPGESWSALIRRLVRLEAQRALFDPSLRIDMTDEEADAWIWSVYAARDEERDRHPPAW